ncbi:MAG: hypothetical protein IPL40_09305 [Proteobacteria bacterium]|nr:hypothetical protein [Pseudomonadota bacterium]
MGAESTLYTHLLGVHSYWRWVVLLTLLAAIGRALAAGLGRRPFGRLDRTLGLAATIAVDLQLLTGLVLFAGVSPLTRAAFAHFAAAMRSRALRFWAVEHLTLMLTAVIVLHVGQRLARRVAVDQPGRQQQRTLITLVAALLLILAAIPWPFLVPEVARPLWR